MLSGTLLRMGDHTSPTRVMSEELENTGKRGQRMGGQRGRDRVFGITEGSSTVALDPGAWYSAVYERGGRCMTAWVREDEKASEKWPGKKIVMEAVDKVEVSPGVTV